MYMLRLSLLAVLCVSALNAGDEVVTISVVNSIHQSPTLILLSAKLAADNFPLVDGLPNGFKDNCVVNAIANTRIAQFLSPLVSKQDVDRVVYAAALEYALQKRASKYEGQAIAKIAAAAYVLSAGTRAVHALANHYGFERYVETPTKVVNNIAYGITVHQGFGLAFGN